MSSLAEHTIAYAKRDWPVFPLKPGSKVPLIPKAKGGNGVHDATCDAAQIAAWWREHPNANIGLACGVGFWALDVDYKGFTVERDGLDSLHALMRRHGPLPRTLRAQTGSGGHYCFAPDPRVTTAADLLPGLDTRAAGGYIVAAPSLHPCGERYHWIEPVDQAPIAPAPAWLIAVVEPLEPEEPLPARPEVIRGDGCRYAVAALENAYARIERAVPGCQCDTLDREAYSIGRLVAGGVLPHGKTLAALVAAGCRMASQKGRHPWSPAEVRWRIGRAFAAASRSPRILEGSQ